MKFQSSTCGFPVFPTPFGEKILFSPTYAFSTFAENQKAATVWTYF
jgi:hypothetical protein